MITLVLGQQTTASIILDTQTQAQQLFNVLMSINRLGYAIDALTPEGFKDGRHWMERMAFLDIRIGSVIASLTLDGGHQQGTNSEVANIFTAAIANQNMDGLRYISSSVESVGASGNSS